MAPLSYEAKINYGAAVESTETLAVVLDRLLASLYGDEWLEWDPTTIYLELKDDLEADPSSETMDRISALLVLKTSDEFFTRADAFSSIVNTLASGLPSFNIFDPVTAEEAAWALTEAAFIRRMAPFSESVKTYLRTTLSAEGLLGSDIPVFQAALEAGEEGLLPAESANKAQVLQFLEDQTESMVYQLHELEMGDVAEHLIKRHG